MDVSDAAFANQVMYHSNPSIMSFDATEFQKGAQAEYSPLQHEMSVQSYLPPSKRKNNINGFKYDKELSSSRTAIYVHNGKTKAEKKVVQASRGTNFMKDGGVRDVGTDVILTLGEKPYRNTRHFTESEKTLFAVKDKYPKHSLHTTGHSLGAKNSLSLLNKHHDKIDTATTYNAPGSIGGIFKEQTHRVYRTKHQKDLDNRTTNYQSKWDPVSLLKTNQRTIGSKNKASQPHDLGRWAQRHNY
jgi:hypothetical protein